MRALVVRRTAIEVLAAANLRAVLRLIFHICPGMCRLWADVGTQLVSILAPAEARPFTSGSARVEPSGKVLSRRQT